MCDSDPSHSPRCESDPSHFWSSEGIETRWSCHTQTNKCALLGSAHVFASEMSFTFVSWDSVRTAEEGGTAEEWCSSLLWCSTRRYEAHHTLVHLFSCLLAFFDSVRHAMKSIRHLFACFFLCSTKRCVVSWATISFVFSNAVQNTVNTSGSFCSLSWCSTQRCALRLELDCWMILIHCITMCSASDMYLLVDAALERCAAQWALYTWIFRMLCTTLCNILGACSSKISDALPNAV